MTPKVYSINLASYIILLTGLKPTIAYDGMSNLYYMEFPVSEEVANVIRDYKYGEPTVELHKFIEAIKVVRQLLYNARTGA